MAGDEGAKVFPITSSLEAAAKEPGHRTDCASKETDGGTMDDKVTRVEGGKRDHFS